MSGGIALVVWMRWQRGPTEPTAPADAPPETTVAPVAGTPAQQSSRHAARRAFTLVGAVLAIYLALGGGALAYWTVTGDGHGNASAGTLAKVTGVSASPGGTSAGATFDVNWTAISTPAGVTPSYVVRRHAGASSVIVCTTAATSCSDSGVGDGSYTYTVTAALHNWAGAESDDSGTVTVDTSAPVVGAKPSSPSADTAPSIAFTHGSYSTFRCRLDSGSFTACSSPQALSALNGGVGLSNGSHTFQVRALDPQGSPTQTASYMWTVAATAPSITTAPAATSANSAPSFAFSHASYTSFQCQLDAAPFTACTSPKSFTGLADGAHTFRARALDADGVATPVATSAWTINTTAPSITGGPSNPTTATTASFTFSHTAYTSFMCRLDSAAFAACTSPASYTGLAVGSHTFRVEALDANGVATQVASSTWTINAPGPTITMSVSPGNGHRTVFSGTTTANTGTLTVQVYLGATATGSPVRTYTTTTFSGSASPFSWSITSGNNDLSGGTQYTAVATHVDGAGHAGNQVTVTFTAT
jgi:hypothetical protein